MLATVPSGFTESVIATNLTSPITMAIEPSGERIWVAFQDGRLGVIEHDVLLPQAATTLPCDGSGERGFQGITLDPDFETNGYIYVYYTAASPGSHNRLSRLTVNSTTQNTIEPGSEVVLLDLPLFTELPTNQAPIWHMGGAIHFLADGTIAIQVGDHLNNSIVQNNNSPLGKVLRVNKDGSAPTNNPYYNAADTNPPGGGDWNANAPGDVDWIDYVWASGLRNPFSGDVDPDTGRYFVNDVGEGTWEEINDATVGGRNFGWPTTEGSFNPATYPNFTNPVLAYNHSEDSAITGGAFYSASLSQFPAQYSGKYFYSQFTAGRIKFIDPNNPGASTTFASGASYPMNIEVAPDGSLYYIARGAGAGGAPGIGTGQVLKIQYASNIAPHIALQPVDQLVSVGYAATFQASASGATPLALQWQRFNGTSFVDVPGATSATLTLQAVALADDGAQFRLVATNGNGMATSNVATLTVTTDAPPTPTILLPSGGATYAAGDVITFSGQATDAEDGSLGAAALSWQVDFHHESHAHPFMPLTSGVSGGMFTIPTVGETSANVWYRITLKAKDSAGLETQTFRDVYPRTSQFSVVTNFGAGTVLIDGQTTAAPFSTTGVVNIERTLTAPLTQVTPGGKVATFVRWQDGEVSPSRTISTPETPTAYIAVYADASQSLAFLSDLLPSNAPSPNGWGPIEKDASNGEAQPGDGIPMKIENVGYAKGLGVHAYSDVRYNLAGNFQRFIADVGLDDETGGGGTVVFQVFGDGVALFSTGVLNGSSPSVKVDVSVAGVNELRLTVAEAGDGNGLDHANWANARLLGSQTGPQIFVNFQTAASAIPAGYLVDAGDVFGVRGNGYSYGWSSSHLDVSRERNVQADQRLDTLNQFHAGQTWEIALPNGVYAVTTSIGDPGFSSTHTLNVEGVSFWNSQLLAANEFRQRTLLVTVADGRLTLDPGAAGDKATRPNYIEIVPTASPTLFPVDLADFDADQDVDGADFLAWQRGLGAPTPSHAMGDADRDGDVDPLDLSAWHATFGVPTQAVVAESFASSAAQRSFAALTPTAVDAAFANLKPSDLAIAFASRATAARATRPLLQAKTSHSRAVRSLSSAPVRSCTPAEEDAGFRRDRSLQEAFAERSAGDAKSPQLTQPLMSSDVPAADRGAQRRVGA